MLLFVTTGKRKKSDQKLEPLTLDVHVLAHGAVQANSGANNLGLSHWANPRPLSQKILQYPVIVSHRQFLKKQLNLRLLWLRSSFVLDT